MSNAAGFARFLLTALKNFLSKEWQKAKAQKRGGDRIRIPLDFERGNSQYIVEPASGLTAEQIYDRAWAIAAVGPDDATTRN